MDKLDFVTILQMKRIIRRKKPDFEWMIRNFGDDNMIYLDDGSQSYFTFYFDKEKYNKEEVEGIADELALFLGVECEITELKKIKDK